MINYVSLGQVFYNAVSVKLDDKTKSEDRLKVFHCNYSYNISSETGLKDAAQEILDIAGDGNRITKEEFFTYVKSFGSNINKSKLKTLYNDIDINNSKDIDLQELQSVITTLDNMDKNKDGKISGTVANMVLKFNDRFKLAVQKAYMSIIDNNNQ